MANLECDNNAIQDVSQLVWNPFYHAYLDKNTLPCDYTITLHDKNAYPQNNPQLCMDTSAKTEFQPKKEPYLQNNSQLEARTNEQTLISEFGRWFAMDPDDSSDDEYFQYSPLNHPGSYVESPDVQTKAFNTQPDEVKREEPKPSELPNTEEQDMQSATKTRSFPLSTCIGEKDTEPPVCYLDLSIYPNPRRRVLKFTKHFWKCSSFFEDENGEVTDPKEFWGRSSPLLLEEVETKPLGYFRSDSTSSASEVGETDKPESSEEYISSSDITDDEGTNNHGPPKYFSEDLSPRGGDKTKMTNDRERLQNLKENLSSSGEKHSIINYQEFPQNLLNHFSLLDALEEEFPDQQVNDQSASKDFFSPRPFLCGVKGRDISNRELFEVDSILLSRKYGVNLYSSTGDADFANSITEDKARVVLNDYVAKWRLKNPWQKSIVFDTMTTTHDGYQYVYIVTCGKPTPAEPIPDVVKIYVTISFLKKSFSNSHSISYTFEGSKIVRTRVISASFMENVLLYRSQFRSAALSIKNMNVYSPRRMAYLKESAIPENN